MSATYKITRANFAQLKQVEKRKRAGTNVTFNGPRGRIETVWVNNGFTFSRLLPAGLVAEAQFAEGYRISVNGKNSGTVTIG